MNDTVESFSIDVYALLDLGANLSFLTHIVAKSMIFCQYFEWTFYGEYDGGEGGCSDQMPTAPIKRIGAKVKEI